MDEVTATQAASLSGVSERTIRRRIADGRLPARRVAPNRFAIRVQDLPLQRGFGDLALRLEALERRVAVLELRQQVLLRMRPTDTVGSSASASTAAQAAENDALLSQFQALLAELARESERLAPLLGAMQPAGEDTGTTGRDTLRPVRREGTGGRQA